MFMKFFKNKKGDLQEVVVFLLLGLVIFILILVGLTRIGNGASFYEQVYSKKIALIIDKAEPGMKIELDVLDMIKIAEKNDFNARVDIDNNLNKVVVRLSEGKGYSFYFFNNVDVVWSLDSNNGDLYLEIIGDGEKNEK